MPEGEDKNLRIFIIVIVLIGLAGCTLAYFVQLYQQDRMRAATPEAFTTVQSYDTEVQAPGNPDLLIPCNREGAVFTNVDGTKYVLTAPTVSFDGKEVSTEEAYGRIKLYFPYEVGTVRHPVDPNGQLIKVLTIFSPDPSANMVECPPHLLSE